MGVKLKRNKKRNLLLTLIYRGSKLFILPTKQRLKLFADLEWIFNRLTHEESFKYYKEDEHPLRTFSLKYILDNISSTDSVVDIGCKYGEISNGVATKARHVTAIDFDSKAIELAKIKFKKSNLEFVNQDAFQFLKKRNEKYNVLILSHLLEHLDNPEDFINTYKEFFDRIYIELPDFDNSYLNHYRKDVQTDLIYSDSDHVYEFDRFELKEIIKNCGLTITSSEYRFGVQRIWCENI